jgi:hypothetical protein
MFFTGRLGKLSFVGRTSWSAADVPVGLLKRCTACEEQVRRTRADLEVRPTKTRPGGATPDGQRKAARRLRASSSSRRRCAAYGAEPGPVLEPEAESTGPSSGAALPGSPSAGRRVQEPEAERTERPRCFVSLLLFEPAAPASLHSAPPHSQAACAPARGISHSPAEGTHIHSSCPESRSCRRNNHCRSVRWRRRSRSIDLFRQRDAFRNLSDDDCSPGHVDAERYEGGLAPGSAGLRSCPAAAPCFQLSPSRANLR